MGPLELALWIRIRIWIRVEIKSWILTRIETNADPQHWLLVTIFVVYSMTIYLQELRDSIQLTPSVPRTAIASQSAARSQPGGQARSQLAGPDLRNVETIILENIHLTALSSRCNLLVNLSLQLSARCCFSVFLI
jgi:hypothetical protein